MPLTRSGRRVFVTGRSMMDNVRDGARAGLPQLPRELS